MRPGARARGAVVVCGGLGGVMAAVARGAHEAGGVVVGLLPGDDRTTANPHLTVALTTGLGEMRNPLVVRAADAVLAVAGGHGTLSELAFALRTGVPVVGLRHVGDRRRDRRRRPGDRRRPGARARGRTPRLSRGPGLRTDS